jgi:hypothetical protein
VIAVTEARLVNTLTSTSLTSRSRVISALGRYNQKCGVVENEYVWLHNVQISALLLKRVDLAINPAVEANNLAAVYSCSSRCRSGSTSHGSSDCPKEGGWLWGKSLVIGVEVNLVAVLEVANGITGGSSTSLWTLQDPLIIAVATPPISIHCAIVDPTTLSAVLPELWDLWTVTLISSVINDQELLAVLIRLIIGIVEGRGFGDCGPRRELGTPVTTVRVVRIHLVDGDEVY